MLEAGEVDAAINLDSLLSENVKPLFADAAQLETDWFASTGVYPINHIVTVKADLAARHPELLAALFEAMARSKQIYLQHLAADGPANAADEATIRLGKLVGGDPFPSASRRTASHSIPRDFVHRQKIIPVRYSAADIFPAELSGVIRLMRREGGASGWAGEVTACALVLV